MRWPWRRNSIQLIGGEVRGHTTAPPRNVWAQLAGEHIQLEPAFVGFEDRIAVWRVEVAAMPEMMGGDYPPGCAIEWCMPGLAPWRHPDGRD